MPRYFFSTEDGGRDEDHEGIELPNLAEARVQAIVFAAEVLKDEPSLVLGGREFKVEVSDAAGTRVLDVIVRTLEPSGE